MSADFYRLTAAQISKRPPQMRSGWSPLSLNRWEIDEICELWELVHWCEPPLLHCSMHRLPLFLHRKDGLAEGRRQGVFSFHPWHFKEPVKRKRERQTFHHPWRRNHKLFPCKHVTFICSSWLLQQVLKSNQQQNFFSYTLPLIKCLKPHI